VSAGAHSGDSKMKEIRDPLLIIGQLERGDFVADLNAEIQKVIPELQALAGDRGRASGTVSLTFKFTVKGDTCEIEGSIDSKTPKKTRGSSTFFVTKDGALSDEHPMQLGMFPRKVETA
jgi:hypothetical protein